MLKPRKGHRQAIEKPSLERTFNSGTFADHAQMLQADAMALGPGHATPYPHDLCKDVALTFAWLRDSQRLEGPQILPSATDKHGHTVPYRP